ncbi:MAG TPA: DUF4382 domain-containing protein [bacterium]
MRRFLSCMAVLLLALVPAACSSGGDGGAGGETNLRINLTDAPMMSMRQVNVTITSVRIHQSADAAPGAAGWHEIPVTAPMPVDLMRLRGGVLQELCSTQLAAGHYQQVRLVMMQNAGSGPPYHNSVMTADGQMHPVDMPGELKIVHSFNVAQGALTDLTLDFDAQRSMRQRGNGSYFMQPVIGASSSVH